MNAPNADEGLYELQEEERREIQARIDELVEQDRGRLNPDLAAFRAPRRGTLFPFLVNLFAMLVVLGAAVLLPPFFDRREETLVAPVPEPIPHESRLFEAVRREAEEMLQAKDLELNQIQQQFVALNRERDSLRKDLQEQVRRQEAGFQESLVNALVEQRARLEAEGVARTEVEARLREMELQLRREQSGKIEEIRRNAESAMREKEALIAAHLSKYNEMIMQARLERERIEQSMAARLEEMEAEAIRRNAILEVENARLTERLARAGAPATGRDAGPLAAPIGPDTAGLLDRLLDTYGRVQQLAAAARTSEALEELASLRTYLGSAEVLAMPGVGDRLAGELYVVDVLAGALKGEAPRTDGNRSAEEQGLLEAIRQNVARADRSYQAGNLEEARRLYREALGRVAGLEQSHRRLLEMETARAGAARQDDSSRVAALRAELQAAQRQLEARRALSSRYAAVLAEKRNTRPAAEAGEPSREDLLELVQAKVLTREIVGTEPVRSRYPGLYENLTRYFEEFDKISRREGRREGLREVLELLNELLRQKGGDNPAPAGPEAGSGDPYPLLLRSLQALLQ